MNEVVGMISQQRDSSFHGNRVLDTNRPFWVLGIQQWQVSLDWPNEVGSSESHMSGDSTPWFHAITPDL